MLMGEYFIGIGVFFPEIFDRRTDAITRVKFYAVGLLLSGIMAWNGFLARISLALILMFAPIVPALSTVMLHKNFWNFYVWYYTYLCTLTLIKLLILIIRGIAYKSNMVNVNLGPINMGDFVTEFCIFLLLAVASFFMRKLEVDLEYICKKKRILVFLLGSISFLAMNYIMMMGQRAVSYLMLSLTLVCMVIVVLFCTILLFRLLYLQLITDKNLLLQKQEHLSEYYDFMQRKYEEVAKINHDYKHEKNYLLQCIENDDIEAAKKFLQKEETTTVKKAIWTGNNAVDFILNLYKESMENNHVEFRVEGGYTELPIPEADFCILLGLLLENAVEAASKCAEKRWIELSLMNRNEMFQLCISNSSTKLPVLDSGRFRSSKENSILHGWGIENVKAIVDKYKGTILFHYTESDFKVEITFWQIWTGLNIRIS